MKKEELKQWRTANGYSQASLAKALGVAVLTVSRWETGLRAIPSFLHLALAYLELKGKEIQSTEKRKRERRK